MSPLPRKLAHAWASLATPPPSRPANASPAPRCNPSRQAGEPGALALHRTPAAAGPVGARLFPRPAPRRGWPRLIGHGRVRYE